MAWKNWILVLGLSLMGCTRSTESVLEPTLVPIASLTSDLGTILRSEAVPSGGTVFIIKLENNELVSYTPGPQREEDLCLAKIGTPVLVTHKEGRVVVVNKWFAEPVRKY